MSVPSFFEKPYCSQNISIAYAFLSELGYSQKEIKAQYNYYTERKNLKKIEKARQFFYSHDKCSSNIFDWVCQARIIEKVAGNGAFQLMSNVPYSSTTWAALERVANGMKVGTFLSNDYLLDRIDTWLLEAYTLPGVCETKSGDIVFDCGAFTGSTSIYFSQRVGPRGHVYGFEPVASIYNQYKDNISSYSNISPNHLAVVDKERDVTIRLLGPGSGVVSKTNEYETFETAHGLPLDSFIEKKGITKLDFIKMDVEGAEASALRGCSKGIQKYKPHMAISIYHKTADLITLPQVIRDISPDYIFYLRHFSRTLHETVLYCVPRG